MVDTDTRTNYTAGLRALADLIDNNPDLPLPYTGSNTASPITFYVLDHSENPKDVLAQIARLLPGKVTKDVSASGDYFTVAGTLHGLHVDATAYRNAVCERVVVGSHEVTVAATPAIKATKATTTVVEDVTWVCSPLLADAELCDCAPPIQQHHRDTCPYNDEPSTPYAVLL